MTRLAGPGARDTIQPMHSDATANPGQAGLKGRGDAWAAAEAYGCDMSLIEASLRKTPRERIHAHCRALATAVALRNAMESRPA
jgi:hypothetical protein